MLHVVQRGDFVHDITEKGTVESASNIEVRCNVQSQNMAGTRILEIVPEGTYVWGPLVREKREEGVLYYCIDEEDGELCRFEVAAVDDVPKELHDLILGEVICQLDSSALENDELKQKSVVENANAQRIQAESDHETAKKALEEYQKGTYEINLAELDAAKAVAQESERRALDTERWVKQSQLLEKGYITKEQLEADEFAKQKAITDRKVAELRRMVLVEYTQKKMEVQLRADIDSSKAKLEAANNTYQLEKARLDLIETQIRNCTVRAPADGQVVYANVTDRMGGQEIIIEEGTQVRERQVIVRLPDPERMQVKARINESKIALVREGQPATIRLDALPDREFQGMVSKVNEYPVSGGFLSSTIKEYETTVSIVGSPEGLRPGLTAAATIRVAEAPNAIQVPVQAVLDQSGRFYCMARKGDQWEARPVEVGAANDKSVIIRKGIEEGEQVALSAAALRDKVSLPDVPPSSASKMLLADSAVNTADTAPAGGAPPPGKAPGQIARGPEGNGPPGAPGEGRRGMGKKRSDGPPGEGQPAADGNKSLGPRGAGKGDVAAMAGEMFRNFDKNGDGKIDKDEMQDLPERMREGMVKSDTNGDGVIELKEWTAFARSFGGGQRRPKTGAE